MLHNISKLPQSSSVTYYLHSATWKKRPHTAVEAHSFSSLMSRWFGWLDSWLPGIMHKAYLLPLRT